MRDFEDLFSSKKNFTGHSYRNIYTIIDSQDLFDDIIFHKTEKDNHILRKWENNTSGIFHETSQKSRVFEYGNAKNSIGDLFTPPYSAGRFGDGISYGIWYGALEEETSILESLYHQLRRAKDAFEQKGTQDLIISERRMFKVSLASNDCLDLRNMLEIKERLTHPSDYRFCQEVGAACIQHDIKILLTPSARNSGGTCSPVFSQAAITKEKQLYYLRWYFYRDGRVEKEILTSHKAPFEISLD